MEHIPDTLPTCNLEVSSALLTHLEILTRRQQGLRDIGVEIGEDLDFSFLLQNALKNMHVHKRYHAELYGRWEGRTSIGEFIATAMAFRHRRFNLAGE